MNALTTYSHACWYPSSVILYDFTKEPLLSDKFSSSGFVPYTHYRQRSRLTTPRGQNNNNVAWWASDIDSGERNGRNEAKIPLRYCFTRRVSLRWSVPGVCPLSYRLVAPRGGQNPKPRGLVIHLRRSFARHGSSLNREMIRPIHYRLFMLTIQTRSRPFACYANVLGTPRNRDYTSLLSSCWIPNQNR